ncbi:exocyst complex component Sec5-domain-containing protein [Gamsiella multidivaricata]|uniref:exocyst complex component Sec5-domain-containing protein n=1 Tax=Gamsiella multidivaricata TaxID=101098 RepID=UPI00222106E6|nr:exocyst complex component Sec5-domain-containing protein [Gamsiella multidivaricata]KAI7822728.1 exocyst complex component Sec5-domain-containing protein [Gamsiella multidivaricata]
MGSTIKDIQEIELLRHYHLDKLNPDIWVDEEDLPSWVHDDDINTDHGGRLTPREKRSQSMDDETFTLSEQVDLLGLVKGNILKSKNVRGDTNLISSTQKSFSPQRYLHAVHADTSYDDLCVGVDRLKASIDQRSSGLKVLVQNNFDRFVSAKNVIDSVYDDMKEKTLNEAQDWGTHRLNNILRESYGKAHDVINPVLERREKIEKLRSTVGLLEPYRLFFNLPNTLQESIKQGKYQQVARDYNKGKVLLAQAFPSNASALSSDNASTHSHSSSNLIETKRKVFDRVWSEVERIVARLRADLESQLEEPWRGMEEHERNIRLLFELDTTTDPVWHCLSSQYRWIKKIMAESYDEQIILVEEMRKKEEYLHSQDMTASGRNTLYKQILGAVNSSEFETMFAKEPEVKVWLAISTGVKTLSELLLRLLPDFWKLATTYMEGKIQKVQPQKRRTGVNVVDPQRVAQCHGMVKDILELYSSQMSFMLINNLMPEPSRLQNESNQEQHNQDQPEISRRENSVVTAFFLGKIVTEVSNCVNDVNGLSLRGGAFMVLADMMQRVRWKFVEVVCELWGEDAKVFYKHEDWTLQTENSQITLFVSLFYQFHEYCLRSAYKYASIWTATTEDSVPNDDVSAVVPVQYIEKIRQTFLDALYSFLDGLVHLAFAEAEHPNDGQQETGVGVGSLDSLHGIKKSKVIDITELDSRILITISNLSELRSVTIPKLRSDFEKICGINLAEDGKTLIEVVDQLDSILFDDYIKRKSVVASRVITDGILYGGIDWHTVPKPIGVHSYINEALLSLVIVHAQISEIAPPLVSRALSALLLNMAQDCLRCFQQVERFGMGGMLHATVEMEFMNHTLAQYQTPSSDEILQIIYVTIDRAYQSVEGENLQNEMAALRKVLADARQATAVQFMCFKKPK